MAAFIWRDTVLVSRLFQYVLSVSASNVLNEYADC